ncbi:PTS mannose/fructose/sorbose transporter subunit IIAB [Companilactobacillus bobalius]|uniref:Protein-N(Pi)-phosphohistidine--sugar phosphotransferase n=2 Tax=Companilactobacillus bobalius TaxID=2801451 RepID=A0A202FES5_9LACO|nr:PTS mannose/fructose/sorbose transporter subunit IIAB [Companilactobacillus bobalius]KAE9560562.1 PTS sugar transporter subunit IIB [Companilactobacillus bobalius]KRK83332.1 phosphoenolpyruvate-dependent sugar phosphotransferase system EIIAB, probable mannose specific [Companilactobacillus bobalius DSM 19674]OVE98974.1 Protein-N(pi)-phosphohistidine--sugar phosphotransferase [Companilactobacillus bobalius]GEO56950.1 hypothetical protein LBO01_00790 [Companilactobacillus paralimentarius]
MYVLASHGNYSKETLSSCEMITGKLNDFQIVSFKDPMGIDDVVKKYQGLYEKNNDDFFYIICDIKSGTPANSALIFKGTHKKVRVFSGLSFGLVLSIATGTPIENALEENKKFLVEIDPSDPHKATTKKQIARKESPKKMPGKDPIINVRIDARLIHGQVATMWTSSLSASRIMVIDDSIVKSNVQKMTLKTAVPGGVHLSILTTDGAARRIKENQYAGQRVFIIVRNPAVLSKLTDDGVKLKEINVGNISMKQGARQVAKSVAVTEEDVKTFNDLNSKGINLYHQMVPNDKKQNFMTLLDKGE